MSPLSQRGGDMLVYPCLLVCPSPSCESSMLWICLLLIFFHHFVSCRRSNTKRWPNAGLMLVHRLRCWPTISPVFGYRVVFSATLNVCQHHRRQANIIPALVQSILTIPPTCMYPQHEVLTRTECILASTGEAGPKFNRHWVSVAFNRQQYWAIPDKQTKHVYNICRMSAQCLWWRPNIVQMLYKCFVSTGLNAAQQTRGVESVLVWC